VFAIDELWVDNVQESKKMVVDILVPPVPVLDQQESEVLSGEYT
jgi:hypothetical protein